MIGAFRSVYTSRVSTCIVEYVGQYCESKSVCEGVVSKETVVFKHLNTFSINALSKNLARKRSSALPN